MQDLDFELQENVAKVLQMQQIITIQYFMYIVYIYT